MATFNEILEGGLNNSLTKRLAMTGGSPAPSLTPEIFPVLNLGVAWEELAFNQGWRRWQTSGTQPAVAAQAGRMKLRNPPNSGVLVVVEQIIVANSGATDFMTMDVGYGPDTVDLATNVLAEPRDTRQTPSASGLAVVTRGTSAATFTVGSARLVTLGNSNTVVPGAPWLLWGNGAILIGKDTLNSDFVCNLVWSERGMTRGELLG